MEAGVFPGQPQTNQLLEQLEREGRYPELANELASMAAFAQGLERGAIYARLAEVLLRMADIPRAITALKQSLEADPQQAVSRRWLEVLLAEPDHALEAAEVLEPLYQRELRTVPNSASMLLAILELKANRCSDHDERIAIWVELAASFDVAAIPPERAREIAVRLLTRTALEWPGGVAKWIDRVMRLVEEPEERLQALMAALDQPLTDALTVCELSLAAGHVMEVLDRGTEARPLYERALLTDPTSPEVLGRIDELARIAGEDAKERAARFRTAIDAAEDPERRVALRVALGLLQKNELDDLETAESTLRKAISEAPAAFRAHEALLSVYGALQKDAAVEQELERGLTLFTGTERRLTLTRLGDQLLTRGRASEALERARPLLDEPEVDEAALEFVERLAEESSDLAVWRRVYERRVDLAADGAARRRALEYLGDFLHERADQHTDAAEAWKGAAELAAENDDTSESERLYQRVLAVSPHDGQAARRLLELCAQGDDWQNLPNAVRVLLEATGDALGAAESVLALEGRAMQLGVADAFASVADDVVSRLDDHHEAETRALVSAKARVMASAARYDEAAHVYEALIESFADEQDVRAFVGLVESNTDPSWRHDKRCWLFEWRVGRAEDKVAVLTHWAIVEEQEFGDVRAAIGVLERAAKLDEKRADVFRELARLKAAVGDEAGRFEALSSLSAALPAGEAGSEQLVMAELLVGPLARPLEALPLLCRVLEREPGSARAKELMLGLCRLPEIGVQAVEALERASTKSSSDEAEQRSALYTVLEASEALARGDGAEQLRPLRKRCFERLVALESGDAALKVFEQAAAEFPKDDAIWQAVEAGAARSGKADAALRAYEAALNRTEDPELAEALGKRLVAFAEEHVGNPRALTAPLERMLALQPSARWAFHRVKLALTNEQRWDALFALYERMIGSAPCEEERAALLDEAAIAARDLAGDAERAIGYWESYYALRPGDARVDVALERLYERQQRLVSLISHLTRREGRLHADELVPLRERIAGLWLDLANAKEALAVIENLPKSAAMAENTLVLLEHVFALPAADADRRKVSRRAAKLLKQRYRSLERPRDVAEVLVKELTGITESKERIKLSSELAELRRTLGDEAEEFETLGELVLLEPQRDEHRSRLVELAQKLDRRARLSELLVLTAERVPEQPLFARLLTDAASIRLELGERTRAIELLGRILADASASEARLAAAHRLERLLLEAGQPGERAGVLERIAELAEKPEERRAALLEAARVALEQLRDPERAAKDYRLLRESEPQDLRIIDGLLQALRAGERWQEVVTVLSERAELTQDPARSRQDLGEAALLRAERLADVPGAIDAWSAIRARFGRDEESFTRLSQLFEGAGRYLELSELLAEEAQHSPSPAALHARLAEVHSRHTGDLPKALAAYMSAGILVSAAELFCTHAALLSDDPALALELASRLASGGETPVAERVLRRQIEHYGPRRPKDGVRVHLALAELLVGSGQPSRGLAELVAAADRYPENERVLSSLGKLAYEQSDLERAEQSYRGLLLILGRAPEAGQGGQSRAEVYLAMSQVAAARGDAARAEDHIASAFETALVSEQEALALEQSLHRLGRNDLAERAITARLERARDPARVATALSDLVTFSSAKGPMDAALAERALRLAERCVRELESAGGSETAAWQALRDVFERLGEKERALVALEALAERSGSDAERLEYQHAIASRLLELPGRRDAAIQRLWDIVRRDASLEAPYQLLSGLLSSDAELEQLLEILKSQAASANAAGDTARLHLLLARLAGALEQAGRLREALEAQAILAEHGPDQLAALTKVVQLHERLGTQGSELADALEALLTHETDAERAATLGHRLIDLRTQEWDDEGVERALDLAFERAPARADLGEPLVKRLLERGALTRAVEVLERRLEHAPGDATLQLRLADALSRDKQPERALAALEAALAARAPEAAVRRERARILESLGRADDALVELDAAITAEGGSSDELLLAIERTGAHDSAERWALRAADLYAETGQRTRARKVLEPWAERHPESPAVLTRIGRWSAIDKDFPTALGAYRTLCRIEHGPARRSAVLALARVAESAGKADDAVAEVEAAISEGLDSAELRRELGRLYARTGARLKQGRILLEEARSAKPAAQLELFSRAAELLAAEGATDEALAALEEVQKLEPERADVPVIAATVLAAGGRPYEAREVLEQALRGSEKRRGKPHAKLFHKLAELALLDDDLPEAFEALQQAYQLDKSDPEVLLMLGLLAADLDHGELAFNALRGFIALKDKAVDTASRRQLSRAYTQLGELELGKGQRTVAKRMATRAVETDPDNKSAQRLMTDIGQR